jgi:hypothetical protein
VLKDFQIGEQCHHRRSPAGDGPRPSPLVQFYLKQQVQLIVRERRCQCGLDNPRVSLCLVHRLVPFMLGRRRYQMTRVAGVLLSQQ